VEYTGSRFLPPPPPLPVITAPFLCTRGLFPFFFFFHRGPRDRSPPPCVLVLWARELSFSLFSFPPFPSPGCWSGPRSKGTLCPPIPFCCLQSFPTKQPLRMIGVSSSAHFFFCRVSPVVDILFSPSTLWIRTLFFGETFFLLFPKFHTLAPHLNPPRSCNTCFFLIYV